MTVNSCRKGKHGEREAAKYLMKLGLREAKRGQQRSGLDQSDVVCESLPLVHIEVKYGYPLEKFDLGKELWHKAIRQAKGDSGDKEWCVLWKPHRARDWRLTYTAIPATVTAVGDEAICWSLRWLQFGSEVEHVVDE